MDQRLLPETNTFLKLNTAAETADAIKDMVVRGAPAIGITAAYGVVLAARARYADNASTWKQAIEDDLTLLADARPTAVNLVWAIKHMRECIMTIEGGPEQPLLEEARRIHEQDIEANYRMGELAASLIDQHSNVLTHCNAGSLATGGYGTALGAVRSACAQNKIDHVYADETRPWLQGARLTAWELLQDGIDVTLITEGAAASLMHQDKVQWVIVGSDRIAANGDVANKIGTYSLAVNARYHGVKLMVVAPTSTVDMNCPSGDLIPIESRSTDELMSVDGHRIAAHGANAWNPVFDVTPAALVDAIVTEKGIVLGPTVQKMADMMKSALSA